MVVIFAITNFISLQNFSKIAGKHLFQGLFFNKGLVSCTEEGMHVEETWTKMSYFDKFYNALSV